MKGSDFSRRESAFEASALAMLVIWLLAVGSGYTFDGAVHALLWMAVLAVMLRLIWRDPKPPRRPGGFSDGPRGKIGDLN
jgi:hypothetical protein